VGNKIAPERLANIAAHVDDTALAALRPTRLTARDIDLARRQIRITHAERAQFK
jgi:hypothetical protein